jgi:hypothetical protein
MSTVKRMREIWQKAHDDYQAKAERESAERQKKLQKELVALRARLLPEILAEAEKVAGYRRSCEARFCNYDRFGDEEKLALYREVMKTLKGEEHGFRVVENSPSKGYAGEGNNYSDFYTMYSWTISW